MSKFYLTTAIPYANGDAHLGHCLEIIIADVLARFYRNSGKQVIFQTGTDEYGKKNFTTALAAGKSVEEFLDGTVQGFKDLYAKLNISYDTFIRTSDQKIHYPGVIKIWQRLVENGDIYKGKFKSLYCVGCESFKTVRDLKEGKCGDHPTRILEEVEEENYFFRLSKYKDRICEIIANREIKIVPENKYHELSTMLTHLDDISVSRPRESCLWGIPVPGDESQLIYVWIDALSTYINGQGYGRDDGKFKDIWPANCQIIGKDILKFHAIIWPALLLAVDLPLPLELYVHGFITNQGQKMGKSNGNSINPQYLLEKYSADLLRFYFIGSLTNEDLDFSVQQFEDRIDSGLANNLSNFCYRTLTLIQKRLGGKIGTLNRDNKYISEIIHKSKWVNIYFEKREFKSAVDEILSIASLGNLYYQETTVWIAELPLATEILTTCCNIVRILATLLSPVCPTLCANLFGQLNASPSLEFDLENHVIGTPSILVQRFKTKSHTKA